MNKAFLLLIFAFVLNYAANAQTEISKSVIVDAAGWKRVARLDGGSGRGYNEITLMTTGGWSTPRVAKISWFKGWSSYGGLNLISVTDNGHWSEARLTYDGLKAYLEVNFTSAVPVLKVYLNQAAWAGGDILDGTLPNGGDTVILTAKFGRVNYGEDDFYLAYDGKLGIGTSDPKYKLSVSGGKFNVEKNGDYYGFWAEDKLRTDNPKINLGSWYNDRGGISYNVNDNYLNFDTQDASLTYTNTLVLKEGNVGIGTTTPDEKLSVNGNIHTKEVRVDLTGWSDFVFDDTYDLPTLVEVENHIQENGHLKDIPSVADVLENGVLLGEMDAKLLQKIEELTLYTIEQEKRIKDLEEENQGYKSLEERIMTLESLLK